jgi:hypothetical protein
MLEFSMLSRAHAYPAFPSSVQRGRFMGDRTALILLINIYICGIQADREKVCILCSPQGT